MDALGRERCRIRCMGLCGGTSLGEADPAVHQIQSLLPKRGILSSFCFILRFLFDSFLRPFAYFYYILAIIVCKVTLHRWGFFFTRDKK